MSEKYPSTATPKKIREDGAEDLQPEVEVHPGQVVKIEPPASPDRMAGTEPKPTGRTEDETYRG